MPAPKDTVHNASLRYALLCPCRVQLLANTFRPPLKFCARLESLGIRSATLPSCSERPVVDPFCARPTTIADSLAPPKLSSVPPIHSASDDRSPSASTPTCAG